MDTEYKLTSGQVARMLGIPARTVRSYLATGRLPAKQNPVTGRWRISRADLGEFMDHHGMDRSRLSRTLRIMVVDQDPHSAERIRRTLLRSERDLSVEIHHNCAEALISIGSRPPDLLLLDDATAQPSCEKLLGAIRNHVRTRSVRVLLVGAEEAEQADATLPRHFESAQLVERVESLLPA
ncbi:MAG: helix-turn-helix domain-containing protein [Deltaproteobacteria bacterium]|nr:helix-turn-helix domain-containing protein [Deltaproteobacteria bacterium]